MDMNALNIMICDDDEKIIATLEEMILSIRSDTAITRFSSGEEVLDGLGRVPCDLLVIDIFMTGMNGIEILKKIREVNENLPVTIMSTSTDFALEGFRLHVLRYLEKPLKKQEIEELLSLCAHQKEMLPKIECRTAERESKQILYRDISFFEQKGRNILIHCADGNTYLKSGKLKELDIPSDETSFYECHKSYIVNLNHIKQLDEELCVFYMAGGERFI